MLNQKSRAQLEHLLSSSLCGFYHDFAHLLFRLWRTIGEVTLRIIAVCLELGKTVDVGEIQQSRGGGLVLSFEYK